LTWTRTKEKGPDAVWIIGFKPTIGATVEASLTIGWIGFDRGKTVSKLLALEVLGLAFERKADSPK
jgi:hypothetical protein